MTRARTIAWLVMCGASLVAPARAQEKQTEHTLKLAAGTKSPPATIADMKWLAGRWVGEALGGVSEEIWSAPNGGSMVGVYREEKDKTVDFPLVAVRDGLVHFDGMSFHPQGDALTVYVAMGKKGGGVREQAFAYTRALPAAK
jgi:hypothetical protein